MKVINCLRNGMFNVVSFTILFFRRVTIFFAYNVKLMTFFVFVGCTVFAYVVNKAHGVLMMPFMLLYELRLLLVYLKETKERKRSYRNLLLRHYIC